MNKNKSQQVKKKLGKERKEKFFKKIINLFQEYPSVLIVGCKNIGTQHIKKALRDIAVVFKPKNTLVRKAIELYGVQAWKAILPYIKENVVLVFTKEDVAQVRKQILEIRKFNAPIIVGSIIPSDVWIKAGNTGRDPTKTSYLAAYNIASKIQKGLIYIIYDVLVFKKGTKVLDHHKKFMVYHDINPFFYSFTCDWVYEEGIVYQAKFLDHTSDMVINRFVSTLSIIKAISLEIGMPNVTSIPHSIFEAYKNLLAITLETDYVFEQEKEMMKES